MQKPHKPGCSLPIQILIKASMAGGVGSAAVVDQMGSGRGMVMDSINELTILWTSKSRPYKIIDAVVT